jgi:hypothetical protein
MPVLARSDETIGFVGGNSKIVEVVPTLDTSAYASGDRLGSIMTVAAMRFPGGSAVLQDIVIVDQAKQSQAIDVLFFDESPTVASADNAAIDIADAQMNGKFIGRVSVAVSDYSALAASSEATVKNVGLLLKAISGATDVFALMVCRSGTPTYGASDLIVKFKVLQD